jgi:hypothetical protein
MFPRRTHGRHPKREVWRRILADTIFAYQLVELGKRPAAIRIRQESCSTGCHDPSLKIRYIFPRRWSSSNTIRLAHPISPPRTLAGINRWHCPLGAHLFRYIRDAAGLRVGIGSVASRLAISWPDLPGSGWAESRRQLLIVSLMVERPRCRFRRNVHHLPIHPLHHPPDRLQWYASIGIGHRNLRRHVEPSQSCLSCL